jgi:BirA family biotin operon repressor/biotin-[acetyl-CoA-carboxylase] ligase
MLHVLACLDAPGLGLKWPNDLVAWDEGGLVKLGGIIGEARGNRLLLGLGVNLSAAPDLEGAALPPASLAGLGVPAPDPEALARRILDSWEGLPPAPEPSFRWPAHGDAVHWQAGQGVVLGWESDGRLRVANQAGILRLAAGDVTGLRADNRR